MSPDRDIIQDFTQFYGRRQSRAELAVEREVYGIDFGVRGYTTAGQADMLTERLGLRPGMRLLDVGAGRGWPGLYLAKTTGCEVVLADVPEPGIRTALERARRERLDARCSFLMASATKLPFRPQSFDAIVHTDTL
jgi:2-polyprenyl-3-methyl-5-hydroxy-6-metoxy-1,4-benzoquinol methylase